MTNCTQQSFEFPALKRRKIECEFSGGNITSDGGVLLLRQMDAKPELMKSVDQVLYNPRNPSLIKHDNKNCNITLTSLK